MKCRDERRNTKCHRRLCFGIHRLLALFRAHLCPGVVAKQTVSVALLILHVYSADQGTAGLTPVSPHGTPPYGPLSTCPLFERSPVSCNRPRGAGQRKYDQHARTSHDASAQTCPSICTAHRRTWLTSGNVERCAARSREFACRHLTSRHGTMTVIPGQCNTIPISISFPGVRPHWTGWQFHAVIDSWGLAMTSTGRCGTKIP